MGLFKKAVKSDAKLRLAIAGPSGSGKTYSALAIATGLGGPIALVDTEHGSASKYADLFDFDVAEMHAPYHPDKYIAAIKEAAEAGYKVIVLDSMTHAWNGEGGLLELVEQATKRQKVPNSYTAWHDVTPIQNRLIETIVAADIHIIATMRSKQDYVQEKDNNGKTIIRKVGMAPVQRDGFEYEFDVFFDMDVDNNAIVTKTRCPELTGKVIAKPGAQVANTLKQWLHGASPTAAPQATQARSTLNGTASHRNEAQRPAAPANDDDSNGDVLFGSTPEPWYVAARRNLTNGTAALADKMLDMHRNGEGECTEKQYQYLSGLIDSLPGVGTDGHAKVLSVICQSEISASNRPSFDLTQKLLDYLPTHTKVDGNKVANPNYRTDIVEHIGKIANALQMALPLAA